MITKNLLITSVAILCIDVGFRNVEASPSINIMTDEAITYTLSNIKEEFMNTFNNKINNM